MLLAVSAFLQEQINLHGENAHPLSGELDYDSGDGLEVKIIRSALDPEGLAWWELQDVITGLWAYIVTGMRYRAVSFVILDTGDDDFQIGWGHIVKWGGPSLSKRTAKRELQITTPALPSSANSIPKQNNSSLPEYLGGPIDWPVEDTDLTLRFCPRGTGLGEEALRNLFIVIVEIVQNAIMVKGEHALLGSSSFRYGRLVVLEVINHPYMLTWGHLAYVVLGLIDYMLDHHNDRANYFTIYQGDPKKELAIGKVCRGRLQQDNVTVARRNTADRDEVC